jgi:lia operon protein LiaG
MKRIAIIFSILVFPFIVMGQTKKFEYTPKIKSKVEISNLTGEISLQNSNGNLVVIESDFDLKKPERAEGLKLLGAAEDNTDLGVNVTEENGIVSIQGATRHVSNYKYKIMVPAGTSVSLDYSSPFAKNDVKVDSYSGSLEIKTLGANVKITNSSGPLTINTISGNLEIVFDRISQIEPTSLASINGHIDITIPSSEKVNFEISAINRNVYNNLDLKSNATKESKDNLSSGMAFIKKQGGNSYTLNGGGQKIYLKTISGNIYLRKR